MYIAIGDGIAVVQLLHRWRGYAPDVVVALVCLTSYRLTRLLVRDEFPPIEVQRARVEARWGEHSWQAYLARCPWCMGVWASGAVTFATWLAVGLTVPVLAWGAAAAVTGLLSALEPQD